MISKITGNFFQSENVSGRTDWLTDSRSSLSSFYNIDFRNASWISVSVILRCFLLAPKIKWPTLLEKKGSLAVPGPQVEPLKVL